MVIGQYGCSGKTNLGAVATKPLGTSIHSGTWVGETNGAQMTLSLSKTGKFQVVVKGGHWRSVVRGTAQLKSSNILLHATDFDGKPASKGYEKMPSTFTYSPDWERLTSPEGLSLVKRI